MRPCDVCILIDGNYAPQPNVAYCSACDAWLCEKDRADSIPAWIRRGLAAIKRRF